MSIVLNEYEWAEKVIDNPTLGRKPYETLTRVAKYYTYNGMKKRAVRTELERFMLSCDSAVSVVEWSETLDRAVRYASKNPPIMIKEIDISESELARIKDSLDGKQARRLAFTLLCVSKFLYLVSPVTDHWVNTPDNEIMAMANINTSIRRQSAMFAQLKDAGLIRFSKQIDNLSTQVLFADDGKTAFRVTDFRNLGNQYMMYYGGPYFICESCGVTVRAKNTQYLTRYKYCDECASKVRAKQKVDYIRRAQNSVRICT